MPSKSPAQHRLMMAAAHTPGGYGGVPQKVGQDFVAADKPKAPNAEGGHAPHTKQLHEKGKKHAAEHSGDRYSNDSDDK